MKQGIKQEIKQGQVHFGQKIKAQTLAAWLSSRFPEASYFLGMRPDDTILTRFKPSEAAQTVAGWPVGRVFNQDQEIRWEEQGADYRVWFLEGSQIPPELGELAGPWTLVPGKRPPAYLWGSYNQDWTDRKGKATWIETRIPRPLHYPLPPPQPDQNGEFKPEALFARIGQIEYCAPNGAVQFTRLTKLTACKETS